jgi:hypothetical protein
MGKPRVGGSMLFGGTHRVAPVMELEGGNKE